MTSNLVIAINIFGTIVSIFSIYVTYSLYRKYQLSSTIFFIITSVSIFLWNFLHLFLNLVGEHTFEFGLISVIWIIVVISGIVFVYSIIFGYSTLRYESLNWRMVLYSSVASVFIVLFIYKADWVTVAFNDQEGWVIDVLNRPFWSIFAISIFIADFIEIIIPMVNAYARSETNDSVLLIMLAAILLAIFSNSLEPLLNQIGAPQAIRFLVADFGFLIFFILLLRYPFIGLSDHSKLHQVIIASSDGVPKLMLTDDATKAILASGALISINAVLEEMTSTIKIPQNKHFESRRKIELGIHQFYIVIKPGILIIFQFSNPSGVCYSKFKSLSKIFDDWTQSNLQERLKIFKGRVTDYFVNFKPQDTKDLLIR